MKPLSIKKRRVYFIISTVLFFICIPILILYATGYRFNSTFNLVYTGGIYLSVPDSLSRVYIEDELVEQSGFFQKNVFVQNLRPDYYRVRVEKEGFQSWSKNLSVIPRIVTEAHPFLMPDEAVLVEIPRFELQENSPATTSRITGGLVALETDAYKAAQSLFEPPATSISAFVGTSTDILKIKQRISVEKVQEGILSVTWTGNSSALPYYFCENASCKSEIIVDPESPIKTFDFFPGRDDLLILTLSDGVYVREIDDRSGQNMHILVSKEGADFRIGPNDSIYIKYQDIISVVSF